MKQAVKVKTKVKHDYQITPLEEDLRSQRARQREAVEIYNATVKKMPRKTLFLEHLGDFTMRPITGIPVLILVLWLLYKFVGVFAAQDAVRFTEEVIFGQFINPSAIKLAESFIPLPLLKDFLVGQYGVVTMALTYAFALILPILSAFFFSFPC